MTPELLLQYVIVVGVGLLIISLFIAMFKDNY